MATAGKEVSTAQELLEKLERNISGLERTASKGISSILKDRIRNY